MKLKLPSVPLARIARSRWLPWALVVVLAGTTLVNWALLRSERSEDSRAVEVDETARAFLRALTNFTGQTIEEDSERIKGFAVGDFADEVKQTFNKERNDTARRNRVVSVGTVQSVHVEEIEGNTAKVFAVVQQRVQNASTEAHTDQLRMSLQMIDTPGGWRISKVEILQTPQSLV